MSLKASAWAWEQDVQGMHKLVLLAIADFAGRDNNSAWPSIDTLANRCGVSKRTVIRSLGSLEKAKLLVIEARPNKSNLYKLQGCQIDRGCQRVTSVVSESHLRGDRE